MRKRKFISVFWMMCFMLSFVPQMVFASSIPENFNVESSGGGIGALNKSCAFEVLGGTVDVDYKFSEESRKLEILTDTPLTIKNADSETSTQQVIHVRSGIAANLTLAGVTIDTSMNPDTCALNVGDGSAANVTITLADGTDNRLASGLHCAGLQKKGDADDIGTLTITGNGTLYAQGGDEAAGIGGDAAGSTAKIIIQSGVIVAQGGSRGAGIGGGQILWQGDTGADATDITIAGGTVIATGGSEAAGIGGGFGGAAANISITGGTVTATGGNEVAGIGGGSGGNASNIIIKGGSVKGSISGTPTDGDKENPAAVYPLTIANTDSEPIFIDGKLYAPVNHLAAETDDTILYAYVTGKTHTVQIGNVEVHYHFTENSSFLKGEIFSDYEQNESGHRAGCNVAECNETAFIAHNYVDGICSICKYERLHTVVFLSADGGSAIAEKTNVKWADKVLDGITAPIKSGVSFTGWKCNGKDVTADMTYKDLAENDTTIDRISLTAQWKSNTVPSYSGPYYDSSYYGSTSTGSTSTGSTSADSTDTTKAPELKETEKTESSEVATSAAMISIRLTTSKGNTRCTLRVNLKDLKAGAKLKVLKRNKRTGALTLVNASTYEVDKDGNVAFDDLKKANYQVVTVAEAEEYSTKILAAIQPKQAEKSMKAGKKTTFTFADELNMNHVKAITYKSSDKSVVRINKYGKITAKKAGSATVSARVRLKNEKTKTVYMTIHVL